MTEDSRAITESQARSNARMAWVGSVVALTGVQLVAPSLPLMRDALGLSEPQIALVMTVYLFPAAISSIPIGLFADRRGRRLAFGWSLIVFGTCGALLAIVDSFSVFLVVRAVQGVAAGGLLPLTMTIIGDAYHSTQLIGAQGRRSVAMNLGDGLLPIVGGLVVAVTWRAAWVGQVTAVPLGVAVLYRLTDSSWNVVSSHSANRLREVWRLFRKRSIAALQYCGFLRMFLKFALLTFIPLYLVDDRGLTVTFAGLAIGLSALAGTALAAISGRLASLASPTVLVLSGVAAMGIGLCGVALLEEPELIVVAVMIYGAGDGLMGVLINSIATVATDPSHRASFVAITGAVRNLAKFVAPVTVAVLVLSLPLSSVFLFFGIGTLVSLGVIAFIRPLEALLSPSAVER